MATFKTGRQRTIEFAGTLDGYHSSQWVCVTNPPTNPDPYTVTEESYRRPSFAMGALGCELGYVSSEGGSLPPTGACTPPGVGNVGNRCYARVVGLTGSGTLNNDNTITTGSFSRPGGFSKHITGDWSVTGTFEEWCEIYYLDESDADGFPKEPLLNAGDDTILDGFGDGQKDGIRGYGIRFFEVSKRGTAITATISVDGNSATAFVNITAANEFELVRTFGYGIDYGWRCVSRADCLLLPMTAAATATFNTVDLNAPWSQTIGGATADTTGGCSATAPGLTLTSYCECLAALFPPLQWDLKGRLRAWDQAYPGSLLARVISKPNRVTPMFLTPAGTLTLNQVRYGTDADLNGAGGSGVYQDQWNPVQAWLDVYDLSSSGEDSRDWRLQFRGKKWNAMTISRTDDVTLDNGNSTTGWAAGAHTTLSVVSGAISAAVSGGTGSATRTFSPRKVFEPFRYLRVRVRSTVGDNVAITVTLASRTWNITTSTAGTWVDRDLDLACASDESDTTKARDSRYPIENPGGFPTNTDPHDDYDLGWGTTAAASIAFGGIPDGKTIQIDSIALHCEHSKYDFLGGFKDFVTGWDSGSDNTTLRPWAFLQRDGLVTDIPDLALVTPYSGTPYYRWFVISEMVTMGNNFPGWTFAALPDLSDGWHGSSLELHLLGGGGATVVHGVTPTWTDWLDSTTGTVPAQDLFDEVYAYPHAGRGVWTGDAVDHAHPEIPLLFSKSLRGRAEGLVFGTDDLPIVAARVQTFRVSDHGILAGSGLTDAIGHYRTGTPWGKGNKNYRTELQYPRLPYPYLDEYWQNRRRARSSFRKQRKTAEEPVAYAVSRTGRHARGFNLDGTFQIGFAENVGFPWDDRDTGLTVTSANFDYAQAGRGDVLRACLCESGTINLYETNIETGGLTLALSVGSGSHGTAAQRPDGILHTYRLDSGTVYTRAYDAQKNALYAEQTTNLTGLDDAEIDARYSVQPDGKAVIGLLHFVSSSIVFKTSEDGINFS